LTDLFAEIHVADYATAKPWFERLFGGPPTFVAHETECVWQITEQGYVAIEEDRERAGHSAVTIFADDLDGTTAEIAERGIEPEQSGTYSNGVRKVTYRDADGNEIGFGGAALGED
jgi:hypothetical protein